MLEINSPRPEHAQLGCTGVHPKAAASGLLTALHHQVLNATTRSRNGHDVGSIDAAVLEPGEAHLIPSPPLSPKLGAEDRLKKRVPTLPFQLPPSTSESMVVKAVCSPQTSVRSHRVALVGFLSQYRCLDLSQARNKRFSHNSNNGGHNKSLRRTTARNYTYSSATGGNSNSDFERTYRTRRVTGRVDSHSQSSGAQHRAVRPAEFSPDHTPISRPSTPSSRHRKPVSVSSPLASAAAVSAPNMSWERLPDFSPPLSSLPDNNKCLKVEWKGSSMDLSGDPLKEYLHSAELQLAQILRLPCDLYLDSKRRLFLEKMHRLKQNLPFRRTDAQKACRIDVNKASRLFAAFEKIGWLEDENFTRFL
ncbi:LADA_0F07756g1_1 [Lachancea dasiensis]|uniref:LADA_0F07756g1_1 n=1 Tax=Lachancea dasiensis TaxID=1072105 RepID=A0A1G4JKY0_9SACH|nr:LADA_0F07756g1_1 [Lachancea dasiensis]